MAIGFRRQLALSSQNREARAALWVIIGMCFIIQPAFTLALVMLLAWRQPANSASLFGVLMLGALYLALINVTKLPESDLATYFEAFDNALHLDLTSFLIFNNREPLYFISLYGLANLPGVDRTVYVFLSTLVPYLVFGVAVLRLCATLRLSHRFQLSLLVFLLFSPHLFSLSGHLFRQMLAASLLMLFLVDQAVTGRRRWGFGLLSIMMHYSSIPFFILSLFRPLKQYSRGVNFLFQVLILVVMYVLAVQVAPLFLDVPWLGIVFQRLVNGEGAMLNPLTPQALAVTFMCLAISLFSLTRTTSHFFGAQDWTVIMCMVAVCVVVLISSIQPTLSEISLRYYFYLYFLMGLILPFLMVWVPLSRLLVDVLVLLSVPLFFYNLANGEWTFAPVIALLLEPTWMLWGYLARSLT